MFDIESGTYVHKDGTSEIVFIVDEEPIIFGKVNMDGDGSMFFAFKQFNAGPISVSNPISREQFETLFEFYKDELVRKENIA